VHGCWRWRDPLERRVYPGRCMWSGRLRIRPGVFSFVAHFEMNDAGYSNLLLKKELTHTIRCTSVRVPAVYTLSVIWSAGLGPRSRCSE
jgi:hypothetical protein